MNRFAQPWIQWAVLAVLVAAICPVAGEAANFYRENRNGKVFVLQVDPVTRLETVYNHEKTKIFVAPGAKRLAVLPTAGWGEFTSNQVPAGSPSGAGEIAGDPNGIITLRLQRIDANTVQFDICRGATKVLTSLQDKSNGKDFFEDKVPLDIAVSQYMGAPNGTVNAKDNLRVYLFLGTYGVGNNPAIFRFDFKDDNLVRTSFKARLRPDAGSPPFNTTTMLNWTDIVESGDINAAQAIDVNCMSPIADLLVYQPTRQYSLQHVWMPQTNNGNSWGINYLMSDNRVMKANTATPLTNIITQMHQIFDVGVDLGDAFIDTLSYSRAYYNTGLTIFQNNVNTNTSISNIYYDIHDDAGTMVEIRDGSPNGSVLETARVSPNPAVFGHATCHLFGLSCRNALSGKELVVYEPVYKINSAAVSANEISDNNRNNVPDHIDGDGKGYYGFRASYLIERTDGATFPTDIAGNSLHTDYVLDYVIAHRFPLAGVTANTEFTYREYAIERDPATTPAALIPGEVVHVRVGNIFHRDPDVYGEYNQFGWNGNPGNNVFFWVGNPGEAYNAQNAPTKRNSGHVLGVMIRDTSYATADFFGVVGNDDFNQGQGDLYFLSKQFGSYIRPRIVATNNPYTPPVTGYGLWWKYQYDRATYYGISRTQWLDATTTLTTWINRDAFFIGDSKYSQMVYNVNCGCRGQRFDNFVLDYEASAPLNDFAIVNIGAPPWVTGGLFPTIQANTGTTIFEPDAKVTFVGNYTGRTDLLTAGQVGFRFVVLKDMFIDSGNPFTEPFLADGGKKVVDSYVETGDYLPSPVWSYTFRRSILPTGTDVATFNVYLGIKYNYQDYGLLPYPAYSWDPIPTKDFFAWSNSMGGSFVDGQYHEILSGTKKFGAPLRINIDSRENLTPEHPLAISKLEAWRVDAAVSGGVGQVAYSDIDRCYVASQTHKVKVKASGSLMFLSEIPLPRDTWFLTMGGIMPQADNYRVRLAPDNKQYLKDTMTLFPDDSFNGDLNGISYAWYIRAKVQPYNSSARNLTETNPAVPGQHLLYRGAAADMDGYQLIARGTLDPRPVNQPEKLVPNLFETESSPASKVTITPAYTAADPNHRRFSFTVETPWMYLPLPLDGGLTATDLRDKYEFRIAFQYRIGKWSKVTVRNYNSNLLTDSFSAASVNDVEFTGDDPLTQVERSYTTSPSPLPYPTYRWPAAQTCAVRITDTLGPRVEGFTLGGPLTSGDPFPTDPIHIRLIDNNPHDYMKRFPPRLRMAFETGADQYLKIKQPESLLGFPYTNFNTGGAFDGVSGFLRDTDDSTTTDNLFYQASAVSLASCTTSVPSTFAQVCTSRLLTDRLATITYETTGAAPLVAAKTLHSPAFNPGPLATNLFLYESPDRDPIIDRSTGLPEEPLITDGSGNKLDSGLALISANVQDNDPPQVRLFIQDQMNLDVMVEVTGGVRDTDTVHAPRTLTVKNMKALEDYVFQAEVATTTPTGPGPVIERYALDDLLGAMPTGYTVLKPLAAGKLPLQVFPDSRFRITAQAFDQAGPGSPLGVTLSVPDYSSLPDDSGIDRYDLVFRRGLTGNSYHVQAEVKDSSGNTVIIRVPLVIGAPGAIDVRTIEESTRKENN
ncbi:MAG: hypothetical protein GX442_11500 [Candidatus Riflebacteria bacterium]|nr:hypothetical protein [Candidatus Riflebacteria bacterium]